jgi:hypothetical protein
VDVLSLDRMCHFLKQEIIVMVIATNAIVRLADLLVSEVMMDRSQML